MNGAQADGVLSDFLRPALVAGRAMQARHEAEIEAAAEVDRCLEALRHAEKWAPILNAIRSALPEELHGLVRAPGGDPNGHSERGYWFAPAILEIQELAPIYAYWIRPSYSSTEREVALIVPVPYIDPEAEDDEHRLAWRVNRYRRADCDTADSIRVDEWQRAAALAADRWASGQFMLARHCNTPALELAPPASPREQSLRDLESAIAHHPSDLAIAQALLHLCRFGLGGAS